MRKENIQTELQELAFDFFYWFSRFEFALKENKFLKHEGAGVNAEPGWDAFVEKYAQGFQHTNETKRLMHMNPKRQKVGGDLELQWKSVGLNDCKYEPSRFRRKTTKNL